MNLHHLSPRARPAADTVSAENMISHNEHFFLFLFVCILCNSGENHKMYLNKNKHIIKVLLRSSCGFVSVF